MSDGDADIRVPLTIVQDRASRKALGIDEPRLKFDAFDARTREPLSTFANGRDSSCHFEH